MKIRHKKRYKGIWSRQIPLPVQKLLKQSLSTSQLQPVVEHATESSVIRFSSELLWMKSLSYAVSKDFAPGLKSSSFIFKTDLINDLIKMFRKVLRIKLIL